MTFLGWLMVGAAVFLVYSALHKQSPLKTLQQTLRKQ